jgi:hypothetical protein
VRENRVTAPLGQPAAHPVDSSQLEKRQVDFDGDGLADQLVKLDLSRVFRQKLKLKSVQFRDRFGTLKANDEQLVETERRADAERSI